MPANQRAGTLSARPYGCVMVTTNAASQSQIRGCPSGTRGRSGAYFRVGCARIVPRIAAVAVAVVLGMPGASSAAHTPRHCASSCVQRVQRHERYLLRRSHRYDWRQVTRPYRAWLRSTRMCESGGNYRTATGNGFWGAYQFTLESWHAVGGHGLPSDAEPLEQDYRAVLLLHLQGRGAWPVCG